MPETELHIDVAGYALEMLEPAERVAFERHLEACPTCPVELAAFAPTVALLHQAASAARPPAGLQARTFIAIERDAAELAPPAAARPRRRRAWVPRLVVAGAVLLAVAAAGIVGLRAGEQRQAGRVEVDTRLTSPGGSATTASVRVTETGIGRVVAVNSTTLPGLDNEREFYELWFVGRGDSPRTPDRVSAGTFHPDAQGRTAVRLAAAVVPANYPELSVTREPRDGDPRRTGPEVLRANTGG